MTSYSLQMKLLILLATLHTISCDLSFNCLRKGQDCLNGGLCQPAGTCDCTAAPATEGFNCDIDPALKNPDPTACGCLNGGTCMTDGTCKCLVTHYGSKCASKRDVVKCLGNRIIIFVYPVGFNGGEVFVSEKRATCKFGQVKNTADQADFDAEWIAEGGDGYVRTINNIDTDCGNITEAPSTDGTKTISSRFVNVEFDSLITTSFDVILNAKCEKTVDDTSRIFTGDVLQTQISAQEYQQSETVNKYEPLVLVTKLGDADLSKTDVVMVGTDIKLEFTIPLDSGYATLKVGSLRVEPPGDSTVGINLVDNSCATAESKSILVSVVKSDDARTVTVTIKVFIFVNFENLKITGSAQICKTGENLCAETTDCAITTVNGFGRRKRESGNTMKINENIRVTTDPREATALGAQTGNGQECPDSDVDEEVHCLQQTEIIIVLALLAATVVVLLIACIILTWRLLRSGTKVAEVHPFEFENQSNRSLPRLSPSNF